MGAFGGKLKMACVSHELGKHRPFLESGALLKGGGRRILQLRSPIWDYGEGRAGDAPGDGVGMQLSWQVVQG